MTPGRGRYRGTNIVTFAPRFVLDNQSGCKLAIAQHFITKKEVSLSVNIYLEGGRRERERVRERERERGGGGEGGREGEEREMQTQRERKWNVWKKGHGEIIITSMSFFKTLSPLHAFPP